MKRGAFCPRSVPGASGPGPTPGTRRRALIGNKTRARIKHMRAPETTSWHSASWQTRPAAAAAGLRRCQGTRADRGTDLAAAADRGVLGGRSAARAAGRGAARRGLPAPGRRLRGELRRLRIRHHRQQAQDPAADEPGAGAGRKKPVIRVGPLRRAVRQAALGRHRDARRRDAAQLPRRPDQPPRVHRRGARAPTPSCCCAATSARR